MIAEVKPRQKNLGAWAGKSLSFLAITSSGVTALSKPALREQWPVLVEAKSGRWWRLL